MIEEAITGREIEVAILGNESVRASVPGEIIPSHEFYDYEDKYLVDGAKLLIPAPLTAKQTTEVQNLALKIYGVSRSRYSTHRFLLRRKRTRILVQRDKYDSGFYADIHVSQIMAGLWSELFRTIRPTD